MKPKKKSKSKPATKPEAQSFSMKLRAKRRELGYTQKEMADLLGASLKTYEAWEQDYRGTNIFAQAHILEEMGRMRAKKRSKPKKTK